MTKASGPRIAIRYCTQCHWLLRAAWMAQELLSTFGTDLGEVSLQPGTGGVFVISYDGEVIWERKTDGGFPDVKQLKQRVRDHLDPDRDLGHLAKPSSCSRSARSTPCATPNAIGVGRRRRSWIS